MRGRPKDPFLPLEFVVWGVSRFLLVMALLLAAFLVADVVRDGDSGVSAFGIGRDEACVETVDANVTQYVEGRQHDPDGERGPRTETRMIARAAEVCIPDPSRAEVAAAAVPQVMPFLLLVGGLVLTERLIRQARTAMFRRETARGLQRLAWFLLIGNLAACVTSLLAEAYVLSQAMHGYNFPGPPWLDGLSFPLLLIGLGVLAWGRMLQWAAVLQDEVDATV